MHFVVDLRLTDSLEPSFQQSLERVSNYVPSCALRLFFFFSSRRRHTRLQGDWSSDVCSSDLLTAAGALTGLAAATGLIAISGSLPGFWRWTIGTLVGYASTNWTPSLVWMRARDSILPFLVDMVVFWVAAIALSTRWRTLSVSIRLTVVWLVVAMAGSLAGGHLSWHYFIPAMGPPAVLAALAFGRFRLRRVVARAAVVGVALPPGAWVGV